MKSITKITLVAVSLLFSAHMAFAVDVKTTVPDAKGAAKSAGDVVKADAKAPASAAKDNAKGKTASVKAKIVDINSATDAELKAIPGIGDAYAAKIIAGRPYANKAQLKSRKVVPDAVYEQIKDLIIAKLIKK